MGEVFLAQDSSLERKVALKFLPDFMQRIIPTFARSMKLAKIKGIRELLEQGSQNKSLVKNETLCVWMD